MLLHFVPDQKEQHQSRAQLVGQLLRLLRGASSGYLEIPNCHLQTLPIVAILKKMELRNMKFWTWKFRYLLIFMDLIGTVGGFDLRYWLSLAGIGKCRRAEQHESGGSQQNSKLISRSAHDTSGVWVVVSWNVQSYTPWNQCSTRQDSIPKGNDRIPTIHFQGLC